MQLPETQDRKNEVDSSGQARRGLGPHTVQTRVGKRGVLREVSLRLKGIKVAEVDLSQLLSSMAFTLLYIVSNNGLEIKTSLLIDTGANKHTFIDTKFAKTVERFLGVLLLPLKVPYKVKGFDGQ
jgi:hypothetical protein